MADLGKAYVQIVPSAQGIKGAIEKELSGSAPAAGASAGAGLGKSLISGLKTAFAAAAVGKIVKDAFDAGGDLQQSFGGLDTIYGEAADGAKAYAKQAAAAGISANSYAEQAVSFGAALKAAYGGDTQAAMEAANVAIMDMADNSAKMGTDISSVQAAYQGFARGQYTLLDNLKLGYGGTKTEMERLLADAEKLTGVKYDINNLGDVYNAVHAVQTELGLTGVAAAEAQTTLTGSFGALQASWQNVLAALTTGEGLNEALANLTTSFGFFAQNVLTMLGNLAPQAPQLILTLVNAIIEQGPQFLASGLQLIGQLASGLAQALPEIIGSIPQLFGEVVSAILSVDWLGVGSDIINGIISGLQQAASNLWEAAKGVARSALEQLKSELGIGSPSRVFADEVGRWIPAGVGVGIDDNLAPLNASISDMSGDMIAQTQRAALPGMTAGSMEAQGAQPFGGTASRGPGGSAALYVNGRELARAIFEDMQAVAGEHGTSLIRA